METAVGTEVGVKVGVDEGAGRVGVDSSKRSGSGNREMYNTRPDPKSAIPDRITQRRNAQDELHLLPCQLAQIQVQIEIFAVVELTEGPKIMRGARRIQIPDRE